MRSRGVRLIARLLIVVLYLNGFAPLTAAAAAAGGGAGMTTGFFGGGSGGGSTGASVPLFGPKRYTRTSGLYNLFTDQISVPNWIRSPYVVRIKNGESDGSHRVTGAFVFLSGLPVATPLDFNQHTDTVERPVLLLPILVQLLGLSVKIYGPTGSYVTVTVLGRSGDTAAPSLTITEPPAGTTTSDTTPNLAVTYSDANQSDCQASGVDPSTLKITLDGVDRTSLFTVTPTGATATIPENLALSGGTHSMHVEIRDRAGNLKTADRTFSVLSATQPPTLTITAPADDALVKDETIAVSGTVAAHGSGTLAVQCRVGATTVPATVTNGSNWSCTVTLAEGDNAIVVSATDSGGTSEQTRQVARDSTPPAVSITSPEHLAYTTAESVTVTGTVSDAYGVTVTVNGVAATLTENTFEATVPVGNGSTVVITALAVDAAGNEKSTSITLNVRRDDLDVQITSPVDGSTVKGPMLVVRGTTNHDLPVWVDVNGIEAAVAPDGTFTAVDVPVMEGQQHLRATARDAAGRTDDHPITVRVDSLDPTITIDEPAAGLVTFAQSVRLAGRVSDATEIATFTLNGQPLQLSNGQFSTEVQLPATDGAMALTLAATDSAGNTKTTTINVIVDRTKPTVTIVSPTDGALVFGKPIVVQGTFAETNGVTAFTVDGTPVEVTADSWLVSFQTLPDGPHTFRALATDSAGNVAEASVTVTLDNSDPVLTITSPAPGTITRAEAIDISGTVQDTSNVDVIVSPGNITATVLNGTFTASNIQLDAADGETEILVTATDATGRSSAARILVTRDSTAPAIEVTAPGRLTRREPGQATATVSDANGITQVVWAIGGVAAGTSTAAPFEIPLTVPDGVAIGGSFVVSATATDRAGNVATDTTDVRVGADAAIVGQVLSDATGLPLENATVRIGTDTRTTDAQGRYTLPTDRASIALSVEREGMTSVSRVVSMASGIGAVPVDARLTPLAAPVIVGAEGSVLTTLSTVGSGPSAPSAGGSGGSSGSSGSTNSPSAPAATDPLIAVVVPAAAAGVGMRLTSISAQGLPDLLPLGWSPIAAFDLRAAAAVQGELTLRATFAQSQAEALGGPLTLVEYRPLLQAWVVVRRELALNGAHVIETLLPSTGAFALVMPDVQDPPIVVPAEGEPLSGVNAIEIPTDATSLGSVEPAVIPPTGGTARGQLRVDSATSLPSGTLVQAEVTERFTLPSNQIASEEQRRQDIVLYRAPGRAVVPGDGGGTPAPDAAPAVSGTLPITPSRTFDPLALIEGHVHLDILAGRESARGTTGGREAVTITDADARLVIPANALDHDTAVSLTRQSFSGFLPAHAALTPLAELTVDVPGSPLRSPAELSIAATAAAQAPDTALVIARVERVDGVPFLTVVATAEISGDRVIARAAAGLPGVTGSGRYVFYRVDGKLGFVSGITSAGGEPTSSVLSTNSLPFIARSDRDGRYTVATLAAGANVTVTARVPRTSLEKSGAVIVNNTPATLDLELAPTVTMGAVTPANGTRGVSREPQITVTTATPIAPLSVTAQGVRLLKVVGTTKTEVATRALLAGSGKTLSIVPNARLDAATEYAVDVTGLTDVHGGVVSVPEATFHTAAEVAPTYSPDDLTFSFPNAEGVVTIASREPFPLGVQFLIINSRSGEVVSLGTGNDGSVSGAIRATVDDRLVITITDPDGRVTTVTRSQFVDPATGRTAIGPGGGTVEGPGGIELRIPEGAVTRAVTLKITPLGADDFPTVKPDVPDAKFGSGIRIEASGVTRLAKEAKLVFPVPDELETTVQAAGKQLKDAFFYVFNRGIDTDGEPSYETLDYANVEEAEGQDPKIVTASFPFSGMIDIGGMGAGYAFVMWTFNQLLPGRPTSGVITGQVLRPVFQNGAADPTYVGVAGARVELVDQTDTRFEPRSGAITQADGRYTIFDHRFIGGPVSVKTTVNGDTARATVFAVERADSDVLADPALAVLVSRGVFNQIATANLTLPPAQPEPPAPAITVRVMKTVDGRRVDTHGLVAMGTPLIIGLDAGEAEVTGVLIANAGAAANVGTTYAVQPDPALQQSPRDPLAMRFVTSEPFNPPQAGSYEIRVSALPAFGPAVTSKVTIRVLAGSGGVETDQNLPPAVITAQTVPNENAVAVPVTIFPQVAFTEPVLHIPGNVFLRDASGAAVSIKIGAIGVDTSGQVIEIDEVTSAATVVTALTIQPRFGLAYGMKYTLELASGIIDRDSAPDGPRSLVPFTSSFTTFGPEPIGGSETQFSSPGLVVLDNRAYVLETKHAGGVGGNQVGALRVFDVSDPAAPREIAEPTEIPSPPRDIAGEQQRVAVATTPSTRFNNAVIESGPGNLLIYDVSGATPQWIGAASLTDSIMDGAPNRVVMKDDMAYVATSRKGLQVVDLTATALGDLATAPVWEQFRRLNAPGEIVNRQAVVLTIPVVDPANPNATALLNDIKVGDYTVDGASKRLVIGTGVPAALGLVVIHPSGGDVLERVNLRDDDGSLVAGQAIALTHINGRDLAIVGGHGTKGNAGATGVVAVVDLSPLTLTPRGVPSVIAWVGLTHGVGDIVMSEHTAIVSAPSTNGLAAADGVATLINLANPFEPLVAGAVSGVGSRLFLSDGVLFSTNRTLLSGTQSPLGGLRTTAFGAIVPLVTFDPTYVLITPDGQTAEDLKVRYRVLPSSGDVTSASLNVRDDQGRVFFNGPVQLNAEGTGEITIPMGQTATSTPNFISFEVRNEDGRTSAPFSTSAGMAQVIPPPTLTELSPSRIVTGTVAPELIIKGRYFGGGASAVFEIDGQEPMIEPVRIMRSTEARVTVPIDVLSTAQAVRVALLSGGQLSNALILRIVPPGALLTAATLESIEPQQVPAGSNTFWLTLRGENFKSGDQVFVDASGHPMTTELVSATEMRARVPASIIGSPRILGFRVEAFEDSTVVSETRALAVVGAAVVAPPVTVTAVEPIDIPYTPAGVPAETIDIKGEGFDSTTRVYVRVDGRDPVPVETTVNGPGEVSVRLTPETWGEHYLTATFSVETTFGAVRTASAEAVNATPVAFLTENADQHAKPIDRVLPAKFFDAKGYLLDPATAKLKKDTFDKETRAFRVHLRTPEDLDPKDMRLALQSLKGITTIDSIPKFDVEKGPSRGMRIRKLMPHTYQSELPLAAVLDSIDDGRDSAKDDKNPPFKFSPNDGADDDQTIEVARDGRLRLSYSSEKQNTPGARARMPFIANFELAVCPASQRRKIEVQLYRVGVVDLAKDADILAKFDDARKIWAQLCVDLVQIGQIELIADGQNQKYSQLTFTFPGNYWEDPDNLENWVNCEEANKPGAELPIGGLPAICTVPQAQRLLRNIPLNGRSAISEPMRELGNLAVLPPGSEGAIRMVFIDYFKESVGKNAGAKKDDGVGLAIVPLEYFEKHVVLQSGGDDLDPGLVGLMFISQAPLAGGMVFNGRTIAHEIAHVVVGQSNGPSGDRSHVYVLDPQTQKWGASDEVNILRANSVEPESIRRKRFNAVQEALLQRSIYVTPVTTP